MPKISSKRQITLPIEQCRELGIKPGDEYISFVAAGQITIIKKTQGAAKAILKDIDVDKSYSDEQSLQSVLD